MESVIVYPYSKLFTPILRQLAYDRKFNIVSVIMPGKWYKDGIDASFVDEGSIIGIEVRNNFEEELNNVY